MRYKQIKPLLEQTLMEINMSPNSLRKLASQINAKAGMEFEMIVPNVKIDGGDDFESEPDYEQDNRTRSIRDIREFFNDGDHNSRRDVDNLVEELEQEFYEWRQTKVDEEWASDGHEYFTHWVRNNVSDDEWITGEDDEDEDESFSKFVDREWETQDRHYTDAYNEFVQDHEGDYDDGDWLNAVDYDYMSNIKDNFDINWPYWTEYQGGDDEMDVENIADDFSGAIGRPVNHSTSYHGASREEGTYVVEPDGSLHGDEDEDGGLEFVSPPLPIAELLSDLQKVKRWAKRRGCYTGADFGTGLHINVSVDGWKGIENLDYVKLAILLGDEYVLQQFQRQSNNYCRSALRLVKDAIKKNPLTAKELLEKMKTHMNTAASKLIHTGITDKFTSINTKDGYVEFRSPGGDWLNEFEDKIEPTLLRFVVALDAAVHEDKYKQEYQKKLYKLLEPSMDEYGTMVKDFSDYVAGVGGAPEQVVKDFRRSALAKLQQSNAVKKSLRNEGEWGLWAKVPDRFAALAHGSETLRRFMHKKDGLAWLASTALDPNKFEIRPIPADYIRDDSTQQLTARGSRWEIVNNRTRDVVQVFTGGTEDDAADYAMNTYGHRFTFTTRPSDGEIQRVGDQAPNFYIRAGDTEEIVKAYYADTIEAAAEYLAQWKRDNNLTDSRYLYGRVSSLPPATQRELGAETQSQEPNANRGTLTPHGPGPWEIYRISDNSAVRALDHTNRAAAETEARTALRSEAPELYGVRTRQAAETPAAVAQQSHNAHQAANMQEWTILNGAGAVMGRVEAATQGEANQRAAAYLGSHHPDLMGQEVEVVPSASHAARQQPQQRFEIYKRNTGQSAVELSSTTQEAAWAEAQEMFRTRYAAYNPADYSVRAVAN